MIFINKAFGCSKNANKRSKPDCCRLIFNDSGQLPLRQDKDNKYIELINFYNVGINNKGIAICLAYNPKLGEYKKFDRTNQKVSNYLRTNTYSGYILLNFYSVLSKDAKSLNTSGLIVDQYDVASQIIQNTSYPIFLCYGSNKVRALNDTNLQKILRQEYANNREFYVSVDNKNQFVHVGYRGCGAILMPTFVRYPSGLNITAF